MLLKNAPTQKSWWAGVWKCVWWSDGLRKQISGKLLLLCIEETVVVCVCAVVEWGVRMAFKVAPRGYAGVSSLLAIIRHLARFLLECTFKGVSLPWSAPSIFFTSHAHLILKMHHHPVNNMSTIRQTGARFSHASWKCADCPPASSGESVHRRSLDTSHALHMMPRWLVPSQF